MLSRSVMAITFLGLFGMGSRLGAMERPDVARGDKLGIAPVERVDTSSVRYCQNFNGCPSLAAYWNIPDPGQDTDDCPDGPWNLTVSVDTCGMTGQTGESVQCVAGGTNLPASMGGSTGFPLDPPLTGTIWTASFCLPGNATLSALICSTTSASLSNGIEQICVDFECVEECPED